jgi:hypothetical protein
LAAIFSRNILSQQMLPNKFPRSKLRGIKLEEIKKEAPKLIPEGFYILQTLRAALGAFFFKKDPPSVNAT